MVTRNSAAPRRAWPLGEARKLNDGSFEQEFKGDDGKIYIRVKPRPENAGQYPVRWEVRVR